MKFRYELFDTVLHFNKFFSFECYFVQRREFINSNLYLDLKICFLFLFSLPYSLSYDYCRRVLLNAQMN